MKNTPIIRAFFILALLTLFSVRGYCTSTRWQVTAPSSAPTGATSFCQGSAGSYTNEANETSCSGSGTSNIITWQWLYDGSNVISGATGSWDEQSVSPPMVTLTAAQANTIPVGVHTLRVRYSKSQSWCTNGSAVYSPNLTITVNASPTAVSVSGGGTACGSTTLNASGGSGGTIYYQGTTSNGTSTGTASSSQVISSSGTYYFRARSSAGCWGSQGSAGVTINSLPGSVSVTGGGTFCGSTTITASGGSGGTIYFQGTTSNGTSTGTASSSQVITSSGTYYFRARTSAGCWGPQGSVSVTINPLPGAISGASSICSGTSTTLTSTGPSGSWSVSAPSVTGIGIVSGVVNGLSAGTTMVTFTTSGGCTDTMPLVVYPTPGVTIAPSADAAVCLGSGTTFTVTPTNTEMNLLSQDFSSGLGSWATNTTAGAPANGFQVTSSPGAAGTVGDGSDFVLANGFSATVTSTLTSPSFSTVGFPVVRLTFNQFLLSATPDAAVNVEYSVNGSSTWTAVSPSTVLLNTTVGDGTWDQATPQYNVLLPAGALGQPDVRLRWSYSGNYIWALDNIRVSVEMAAPTFAWTSSSDLSCTGCASPVFTPAATGENTYTVSATQASCTSATATITVTANPLPAAITGFLDPCVGTSTMLNSLTTSGTWGTASSAIATINTTTGMLTAVATGTTHVTYTASSGCYVTAIVSVQPAPAAISGIASVCDGFTTTLSHTSPGGNWVSGTTAVATIDGSGSVSAIATGISEITYTLTSGCTVFREVTVNVQPAAITGTSVVCEHADVVMTSATPGGTWSTANTMIATAASGTVHGEGMGTTTVSYIMPEGCYVTTPVTVDPVPADITGTPEVCLGLTTTLSNTTMSGTWSTSSVPIAAVSATGVVTGATAGEATISYTIANGCFVTSQVTVHPLPANIAGPDNVCVNSDVTLTCSDGGGAWTSSNTSVATVNMFGTVTGVDAGTVAITYTLPTGCITIHEMTVNQLPAAIIGTPRVCEGSTVQLFNSGAGGNWTTGAVATATVSTGGLVSGVAQGTTDVTYTNPVTGCYRTVNATVDPTPAAITGDAYVCAGSVTDMMNADGGGSWTVSNSSVAGIDVSGHLTGLMSGAVTVSYTLPEGCYALHDVTVNPLPAAITGANQLCAGAVTTLENISATGTWSSGDITKATIDPATGIVTGIADGEVNISYTLATGCSVSYVITVNPLPADITGITEVCKGLTTVLSSASPSGTWSSSATGTATINASGTMIGINAGITNISYTLSTGCFKATQATVNPLPAAVTGVPVVCEGSTTALASASPLGVWGVSNPGVISVDASGMVSGITAGTADVTYTLPTGCIATKTVTVNQSPAAFSGNNEICPGATSVLSNVVSGGGWSGGSAAVATVAGDGTVSAISAGTVMLTYTLPTGCKATTQVSVHPTPALLSGTAQACEGFTSVLSSTDAAGSWTSANTAVAQVDASGTVSAILAGSTRITYTLPTGCYTSRNYTVKPSPGTVTGNMAVCEGQSFPLGNTVAGGTWTGGSSSIATVSSSGDVSTVADGSTTVTYTLPGGCNVTADVTVNMLPEVITGVTQVCAGSTTMLSSATPLGVWSISGSAASVDGSGNVSGISAGTGSVTYTLATGCNVMTTVTVMPLPASITGNAGLCVGAQTTLGNISGGGTWSSSNPIAAVISSLGQVSGVSAGFTNISYTLPTGCYNVFPMNIMPLPAPITGTFEACAGATSDLETISTGGTWSTSSMVATVNGGGLVSALGAGTTRVSYTAASGCATSVVFTVHPLPALVLGATGVCEGDIATVHNSTGTGTWSSADAGILTVDASGMISGITPGTAAVAYTLPTGCARSRVITVYDALPAITGNDHLCATAQTTIANSVGSGVWTSDNTTVATVGAISGIVSGIGAGNTTLTYTVPATGCKAVHHITVNPMPAHVSSQAICMDQTATFSSLSGGGTWTISDPAVATVDAVTGVVTPVAAGAAVVSYTLPTGCEVGAALVVNDLPVVQTVSGAGTYCAGTPGAEITMASSEPSVLYRLYRGAVNIGSLSGTGSPAGFGSYAVSGIYSVVATTTAGCMAAMSAPQDVIIQPLVTPVVTITSDIADTVCQGTTGTFTAVPVNGGATPAYKWLVNGSEVAATTTHSYEPVNGDVITVIMHTSELCPSDTEVSASASVTVMERLTPGVSVVAHPGDTVCAGDGVSYVATLVNEGDSPVITWLVNGSVVSGASDVTFSNFPADGDVVVCRLNSSYRCPDVNDVPSMPVNMKVYELAVPHVTINADLGTTIAKGQLVTFTATVTHAGTAPVYQWQLNDIDIPGATSTVYATAALEDGDVVKCNVQAEGICGKQSFNSVTMRVNGESSVSTITDVTDIRLLPNPNNGVFTVRGDMSSAAGNVIVEVVNIMGRTIYKSTEALRSGKLDAHVALGSEHANGMYMLRISSDSGAHTIHFVLNR